ncbi:ABC transporter substrate-binding protein [Streptomyces olivaceiscleroticus]|uniref:ABC transporter substrate-binding protein n=1 Tax=Streptomyces olivaceiscleroticus TaxID=68245 RepID=A0ABN0ZJG2_9ACTN
MATPHAQDRPDDDVPIPRWRYVAALLAALLLVGGGIIWIAQPESTDCAENVKKIEAAGSTRCVGLTDGSYAFTDDLRNVYGLIEKENRRVTAEAAERDGRPYVSIVYLLGMKPGKGDSNTTESVRHEVEGAYTAQYEVNHGRGHGQTPQIKLLLGDTGDQKAQRDFTLDRIKARRGPDRIVAAAGLGTSLTGTNAMISKLNDLDIAAFGSVITADELEKNDGLVRVAAPNADEAAAAVQFLTKKHGKDKVLIVQDANKNDLYTKTLASRFAALLPKNRLAAPEPMQYDSSKSQLATYFNNQMPNLCLDPPGVVYFAGRGRDLPDFLAPLANRRCKSAREITVLSGDDASQAAQAEGFGDVKQALRNGNIRLLFTGLAHPGAWAKAPQAFDKNAIVPFQEGGTFTRTFKDDTLDDGQAIMGYDAVLTAVTTIRKSVHLENSHQEIERDAVLQMLRTINGANAVPGASGWISLQNNGSPERKAIPIIEIDSAGTTRSISVSANTGKPYASE